jgi:periplasmic protein TonB
MVEQHYDQPPRIVDQPRLVYPLEAFQARVTGMVDVEVLIDETGHVARAEIRRSIKGLDEAALANVRQWRFEPARKAGKPVPTTAIAPVTFRIY